MDDCTHTNEIDLLFWKIAQLDDEDAFRSLFFKFFSSLCVFAHRYIEQWETCEDIVQDTFFKIWKNRKKMIINTSGRNLLLTSVRNSCVDYLRKQEIETSWIQKKSLHKTEYSTDDLYATVELENMLNAALSNLPENIRQVFEMSRFEGLTYTEIATQQRISIKTVEAYITKALKQLRIELKDYLPLALLLF
ncbi:RNA polymerase sigma-70 factor [Parabacteroides acidifaciens]|uniref:RNA polymerase sigma-70 factor n=1 Tax=Parabacteroides acidifaciens TaxID=2290935 RepID=A0A3D8HBE4_9BACT|nr:RNA polymerase sigma-70 factor [Parabacteroides acidifaciens]RDU48284.1 RNA polymerase sigma-70 factor [Parabacteroides acidifaciens]